MNSGLSFLRGTEGGPAVAIRAAGAGALAGRGVSIRLKRSVKMKRECLEELRALINLIRSEGRDRRRVAADIRWMLLSFLKAMPRLERAAVPVSRYRWTPSGGTHRWN